MRQFVLLCLLASLFLQCQNSTSSSSLPSEQEDALSAICDCVQPSIKLNTKMEELMQTGDREAFIQMVEAVGQQMEKSLSCCQSKWEKQKQALEMVALAKAISDSCEGIPPKMAIRIAEHLSEKEERVN